MTNKLKVGIIGCGGIANGKHLPALAELTELCEMVAFCDLIEERAEKAAAKYGIKDSKIYTDYHKLLEDDSIDVVHVLTPNVAHAPISIAALEAGKYVMCEKPMAHTSKDAKAMLDAAKKAGKKFTIGYQNRFRQDTQLLHKACVDGKLGDIYFGKAHALRRRAVPTWGVFQDKAQQGGGPLIDIGTHALDLALWMMDNYDPAQISGTVFYKMADKVEGNLFGPWDPKTYDVEDSAFGFIKMKNGATIYLESSWALNIGESREASITLCGTEAGAEIWGGIGTNGYKLKMNTSKYGQLIDEEMAAAGNIAYYMGESTDPGHIEAKQWIEAILYDKEPLVKPEEAYIVTKILEAIYNSAETGKEILF